MAKARDVIPANVLRSARAAELGAPLWYVGRRRGPSKPRRKTLAALANAATPAVLLALTLAAPASAHVVDGVNRSDVTAENCAEYAACGAPSGASGGGVPAAIANCESGNDPSAVSPDGQYRGKWQFDRETWASVGGSGDPAAASEAEQDRRAGTLYARRGSSPWPVCG